MVLLNGINKSFIFLLYVLVKIMNLESLILICIVLVVFYYVNKTFIDRFDNYEEIPKRNKNIDSIPKDEDIKYRLAYYYEMNNSDYINALINTFKQCTLPSIKFTDKWITKSDALSNAIYTKIYQHIQNKINESKFLKLDGDYFDPPKIQIMKDTLLQYKISDDMKSYLFDIEMVLFREGKINGKHVKFYVISDGQQYFVIYVNILGIIGEDMLYDFKPSKTIDDTFASYSETL